MLNFDGLENEFKFCGQDKSKFCNAWVATAIVGSAVIGGLSTAYAANKASSTQQNAANQAAQIAKQQYDTTRGDLAPYREMGANASAELQSRLPFLTSPIDVTAEINDPNSTASKAYNFTRTQGLKATQNSAAARGLGVSGAALKGAATFATGLADNTYTNLFNLENTNRTNAYNRLKGLVDVGQTSAAGTGVLGAKSAETQGNALVGGSNAAAAGINAIGSAVAGAGSNIGGYIAYRGLYGDSGSGGSGSNPNRFTQGNNEVTT